MTGARRIDDELVNLALVAVGGVLVVAAVLRGAGSLAAALVGAPAPAGGLASGLRVLADPLNPAGALTAPGLPVALYWGVVLALLGVASGSLFSA